MAEDGAAASTWGLLYRAREGSSERGTWPGGGADRASSSAGRLRARVQQDSKSFLMPLLNTLRRVRFYISPPNS